MTVSTESLQTLETLAQEMERIELKIKLADLELAQIVAMAEIEVSLAQARVELAVSMLVLGILPQTDTEPHDKQE